MRAICKNFLEDPTHKFVSPSKGYSKNEIKNEEVSTHMIITSSRMEEIEKDKVDMVAYEFLYHYQLIESSDQVEQVESATERVEQVESAAKVG